jgi:hypothetical protein
MHSIKYDYAVACFANIWRKNQNKLTMTTILGTITNTPSHIQEDRIIQKIAFFIHTTYIEQFGLNQTTA